MQIVDVTKGKEEECCCTCKHNIRTSDNECHVSCHCDIDDHYIGYVANFANVCEEWEVKTVERIIER